MLKGTDDRLVAKLLATLTDALEQCSAEIVTDSRRGNPMNHAPFGTVVRVMERLLTMEQQAESIGEALGKLTLDERTAVVLGTALGGSYTGLGLPQRVRRSSVRSVLLGPLGNRLAMLETPGARLAADVVQRITGLKTPAARRRRLDGMPRTLPITIEGALEFARQRGVIEAFGQIREGRDVAGAPEELAPVYARLMSVPYVLSPVEELPRLRTRFDSLVRNHLAEPAPQRDFDRSSDLRSYLPVHGCTPFAAADNGDVFFVSTRARDQETGERVVVRLVHDEAMRVRPWARTIGEHLALFAFEVWGHRTLRGEEVTKRIWRRRVRAQFQQR